MKNKQSQKNLNYFINLQFSRKKSIDKMLKAVALSSMLNVLYNVDKEKRISFREVF